MFAGLRIITFFLNTFNASWVKCWDSYVVFIIKEVGPVSENERLDYT